MSQGNETEQPLLALSQVLNQLQKTKQAIETKNRSSLKKSHDKKYHDEKRIKKLVDQHLLGLGILPDNVLCKLVQQSAQSSAVERTHKESKQLKREQYVDESWPKRNFELQKHIQGNNVKAIPRKKKQQQVQRQQNIQTHRQFRRPSIPHAMMAKESELTSGNQQGTNTLTGQTGQSLSQKSGTQQQSQEQPTESQGQSQNPTTAKSQGSQNYPTPKTTAGSGTPPSGTKPSSQPDSNKSKTQDNYYSNVPPTDAYQPQIRQGPPQYTYTKAPGGEIDHREQLEKLKRELFPTSQQTPQPQPSSQIQPVQLFRSPKGTIYSLPNKYAVTKLAQESNRNLVKLPTKEELTMRQAAAKGTTKPTERKDEMDQLFEQLEEQPVAVKGTYQNVIQRLTKKMPDGTQVIVTKRITTGGAENKGKVSRKVNKSKQLNSCTGDSNQLQCQLMQNCANFGSQSQIMCIGPFYALCQIPTQQPRCTTVQPFCRSVQVQQPFCRPICPARRMISAPACYLTTMQVQRCCYWQ